MTKMPAFAKTILIFFIGAWGMLLLARAIMLILVGAEMFTTFPVPPFSDIMTSLYIGSKFDARLAVFLTIPLALVLFIPRSEAKIKPLRYTLDILYGIIFAVVSLVYIVDFGYFFYLRQRVDSTLFEFFDDAAISFDMVMQSYPVFAISLGLGAAVFVFVLLLDTLLCRHIVRMHGEKMSSENLWRISGSINWKHRSTWGAVLFVCLFLMGYGQISSNYFPLRWSNAYFTNNRDLVLLGLNPVQNLYDTSRSQRVVRPDMRLVGASYNEISKWLHVSEPNIDTLNFWRTIKADPDSPKRNVCLIVMESLSWPMTSFAPGNDDPTPNLRKLAVNGLYFSNYYASSRTTARAVFSLMTGIPDVNREGGTTSRNPMLVRQYIPMSDFDGYEKYYMIGGSASWANIRGVLQHNIPGLHLLEESAWDAPNVDVWGISDLALFRESVGVLNDCQKPFVAVIQTAGFHRPYTIPDDNGGFLAKNVSPESIKNYGYADAKEYNSLRFSDHALGEFFRMASKQPWFENTVFAIVGDHGLYNISQNVSGGYLACALQGYHVPLILYAPGIIEPGQNNKAGGHTDLFPTLARLAGVDVRIHGTGRDLLDQNAAADARHYIAGDSERFRILVEDNYCYIRKNSEGLYRTDDLEGRNLIKSDPARADRMRRFAEAYHQTAKYLLFNNKEQPGAK